MLWFSFIPGLNFVFLCFKLIIIHYHTQTQRKIKFKPRMKLNHNIYKGKYLQFTYAVIIPEIISICLDRGGEESLGYDDVLALNNAERSQVRNG